MAVLTTRQRDILQFLLDARRPLATSDLARKMNLTRRQVSYDLKGLEKWLAQQHVTLKVTPGVGVELLCDNGQSDRLKRQMSANRDLQLVLTPEQRQQLLALLLLEASEPVILQQLEQMLAVSRTTVVADLNALEPWLEEHSLRLHRRPNYGIDVWGDEGQQRRALGAWAWGHTPFGAPLASVTHGDGIEFGLAGDRQLLPIVARSAEIIDRWRVPRLFSQVAYAEAQLGGRFSDDAVLYLALIFAIQTARVAQGQVLEDPEPDDLAQLQSHAVWPIARQIAARLNWGVGKPWPEAEVAFITRYLLAAPRNERWPGDLDIDASFNTLLEQMMQHIGDYYEFSSPEQDKMLRNGILIHAIPAYFRQRFGLWMPAPPPTSVLSDEYRLEHQVAAELAQMFGQHFGLQLPRADADNIALLLRAAYIRERPYRLGEVIVICPSGMASAQLLCARLRARFPRLGEPRVLSVRELTRQHVQQADLVLTTIPLKPDLHDHDNVLQVHQLLFPEDVEAITAWLSSRRK
ncbi:MAG: BglG family transcription antiterminator [Chloroflexota bacterium]